MVMRSDPVFVDAMEVIKREPVRLIDGRYSGGFIPVLVLIQLIYDGEVKEYRDQGKTFVRIADHHEPIYLG